MAITISGENNNDRILASDGVIDSLSGFNVVGVITATSFTGDLTGDVTGNLTGNVTGNINNSTLLLQTGGTERVRIDSSGRVLIGTTTVGHETADDFTIASSGSTGICIRANPSNASNIHFGDGTSGADQYRGIVQYHHADNSMRLFTNANERLRINNTGWMGVGQTTRGHNGEVAAFKNNSNGNSWLSVNVNNNTGIGGVVFGDSDAWAPAYVQYNHTNNIMQFISNGSERLRIKSDGSIQTTTRVATERRMILAGSPTNTAFNIEAHDGATGTAAGTIQGELGLYYNDGSTLSDTATIKFERGNGGANGAMTFFTNNNERLRIDSSGRLLVGTNTNNAHANADNAVISGTGNIGLSIMSTDSGRSSIYFGDSSSSPGSYAGFIDFIHSSNSFIIGRGNDTSLTIDSSGRLLVGTSAGWGSNVKLHLASSTNTYLTITSGTSHNGVLAFSDDGTERGSIDYDHNGDTLNFRANGIKRATVGATYFYVDDGTNGRVTLQPETANVNQILSTTTGFGSYCNLKYQAADHIFLYGGTERLRITSDGKVGINETSPDTMLHLKGSIPAITLEDSDGTYGQAIIEQNGDNLKIRQDAGNASSGSSSNIRFEIDAAERMRIENLGDNEFGVKFFNNKAIEFKSQDQGIFTNTWSISANTWTNFFSIPSYFQAWIFLNSTHNAGNSSALWSVSKSLSGGSTATRLAYDNAYGPATVDLRINGVWVQLKSSYATYGYAIINCCAGGNGVANLSG